MATGGFLYAIGAEGTSLVKIGYAKRVEHRLKALQTGQPFPLHLIAAIPIDEDAHRIEKRVHAFLVQERRRGEWFEMVIDAKELAALALRASVHLAKERTTQGSKLYYQSRMTLHTLRRPLLRHTELGVFLRQERSRRLTAMKEFELLLHLPPWQYHQLENGTYVRTRFQGMSAHIAQALGLVNVPQESPATWGMRYSKDTHCDMRPLVDPILMDLHGFTTEELADNWDLYRRKYF